VTDEVLADQLEYYRHRAGEDDVTAYGDVVAARARIARLVAEMRPTGRVRRRGIRRSPQRFLFLLQDPVSARVRSATFKVMASLPGVRLLGPMTDPLGRHGYALATTSLEPGDNAYYHPVHAVVIDPRTGSLLETEDIAPMPRNVQCRTPLGLVGWPADRGKPVVKIPIGHGKQTSATCIGPSYDGRSYQGQVDAFTVLVSAAWTNASPALPAATQQGLGFPGLNPSSRHAPRGRLPRPSCTVRPAKKRCAGLR
jgi:hypothetical protein